MFFWVLAGAGDPEAEKSPESEVGETFLRFLSPSGQKGTSLPGGECECPRWRRCAVLQGFGGGRGPGGGKESGQRGWRDILELGIAFLGPEGHVFVRR